MGIQSIWVLWVLANGLEQPLKDRHAQKQVRNSQFIKKQLIIPHINLGIQMSGRSKSFQSLVFVLTQLHYGQCSSLPFCLPSLIVQWPARMFQFRLLCMIVKLVVSTAKKELFWSLHSDERAKWILQLTLISHCNLLISAILISLLWLISDNAFWHCVEPCCSWSTPCWTIILALFWNEPHQAHV